MRVKIRKFAIAPSRFIPYGMIIAGCLICVYVALTYSRMAWSQHTLEHEWQVHKSPPARVHSDGSVAKLVIPKIGLDTIVVEGTSKQALLQGPGHLADSALLEDGGNVVIAAHRDTFFRHLNKLVKGDLIYIEDDIREYEYVVVGTSIVKPTDLSAIQPTDKARLTLITCYPFHYIGPAPKRYVVTAELLGDVKVARLFSTN
jgi:sortase A